MTNGLCLNSLLCTVPEVFQCVTSTAFAAVSAGVASVRRAPAEAFCDSTWSCRPAIRPCVPDAAAARGSATDAGESLPVASWRHRLGRTAVAVEDSSGRTRDVAAARKCFRHPRREPRTRRSHRRSADQLPRRVPPTGCCHLRP